MHACVCVCLTGPESWDIATKQCVCSDCESRLWVDGRRGKAVRIKYLINQSCGTSKQGRGSPWCVWGSSPSGGPKTMPGPQASSYCPSPPFFFLTFPTSPLIFSPNLFSFNLPVPPPFLLHPQISLHHTSPCLISSLSPSFLFLRHYPPAHTLTEAALRLNIT